MLRLVPRLRSTATPVRARPLLPHLSTKVHISSFTTPRPIPPLHTARRHFNSSPALRNANKAATTTTVPVTPPPLGRIRRFFRIFRHLRYLKYLPYKTALFLTALVYAAVSIDLSIKDSIEAILAQFTVPENTWLYLNLNDLHIIDSPHSERALQVLPLVSSTGKRRMTMLELTTTIMEAAADPRVKGMILSFNQSIIEHRAVLTGEVIESKLGTGKLEELQMAILKFAAEKNVVYHPAVQGGANNVDGQQQQKQSPIDSQSPIDLSKHCVIAISDNYSAGQYSLATAAHRILMQPSGEINLTGLSLNQFFFGKLLEKWGVDMKVEARRDYKSAMSAYTDSAWNEKTRENLEDLVWSLQSKTFIDLYRRKYPTYIAPVDDQEPFTLMALQRLIGELQKPFRSKVDSYINTVNTGPFRAEDALKAGLIDGLMYHHDLLDTLAKNGIKTWSVRKYLDAMMAQIIFRDLDMARWILPQLFRRGKGRDAGKDETDGEATEDSSKIRKDMFGDKPKRARLDVSVQMDQEEGPDGRPVAPAGGPLDKTCVKVDFVIPRLIAVVYLDNPIEGKGRFGGEATSAYLMKAAKDPSIHGIVFRINSPGGDAVASDTIYQAVKYARQYKPVVASFSDVAASGGYYAAAAADMIYSNLYTITGSIGVIMGYPVIKRLLEKVDVSADSIEFIPNAAWHHPELGDMPPAELEKLSRHVDATYDRFKGVVSEGRNMSVEEVEKVAQGQVFTGSQAQRLGLVDRTGPLNDALVAAAVLSIARETKGEERGLRQLINEVDNSFYENLLKGEGPPFELMKAKIFESHMYTGRRPPTDDEVRALLKRPQMGYRGVISVTTIPHVNPANEALGYAISSAFASEEERSPVPVDQPLPEPAGHDDDGGVGPEQSRRRIVMGALLGLARTNDIPVWQFPLFCYWYAAEAAGKVGEGERGILDRMFAGMFGADVGVAARHVKGIASRGRPPLFNDAKSLGMDVRLEMMPLQIYF